MHGHDLVILRGDGTPLPPRQAHYRYVCFTNSAFLSRCICRFLVTPLPRFTQPHIMLAAEALRAGWPTKPSHGSSRKVRLRPWPQKGNQCLGKLLTGSGKKFLG